MRPIMKRRAHEASRVWLPTSIASLEVWLPTAGGTLWQDSARTTPAVLAAERVGAWDDKSGAGRHFLQATAGERGTLDTVLPSVEFDGIDDVLAYAGSLSDTVGTVSIAFKTGATAFAAQGAQVLFSSADEAAADEWFEIGITSEGRVYVESNAAGTKHTVVGPTFLALATVYVLTIAFDGTDYYMDIGGVEENPLSIENAGTFAWIGDVTGADNLVVGGAITSGGTVRPFEGAILDIFIASADLT